MSLDDIQTRYDEAPKGGGNWNKYPTLSLNAGDQAVVRFLGTGVSPDPLTDSGMFHKVQRISKRTNQPWSQAVFCMRTYDKEANCEYCNGAHGSDAAKSSIRLGIWMWCYKIVRANQHPKALTDPTTAYPVVEVGDRKIFLEQIDGPIVWERGPGKDGEFINQLKLLRDMLGSMNKCDITITRTGAGMNDTHYGLTPVQGTINTDLKPEQATVITALPSIRDLFEKDAEWPPRPENASLTAEQLMALSGTTTSTESLTAEEKKSVF